tara:strand:- start:1033 stop:1359 length:327 start_codon:yes stop_codon:yes gene_type:complete
MDVNAYQAAAKETAIYPKETGILYTTLGLTGEAGEVADKVKKIIRDHGGEMDDDARESIMLELGDVLWYVANLTTELGYSLRDVAGANIQKLTDRQQRNKLHGSGDTR